MLSTATVAKKKLHSDRKAGHRDEFSEEEAACRIQAIYRGKLARKELRRTSYKSQSSERSCSHSPRRISSRTSRSSRRDAGIRDQTDGDSSNRLPVPDASPGSSPQRSGRSDAASDIEGMESSKSQASNPQDLFKIDELRQDQSATDYSLMRYELNRRKSKLPKPVQQWRVALYMLFDEPRSSCFAQTLSIVLLAFIILSIACFMLETMPELKHVDETVWLSIEVCCTIVFTVEYVVRLLVCTAGPDDMTMCKFIRTPMNMCDLWAIFPFYVSLIMSSLKIAKALGILRTVRLIRLFRIFKLGRYSAGLQLMAQALKNSSQALWVLSFFLFIGIVLFSSAIYYVEKMGCPDRDDLASVYLKDGSNRTQLDQYVAACRISTDGKSDYGLCCDEHDSPLDFPSIVEAFWWATVTMTTVGFGEVYPRTDAGRLVATATMLSGILLIALPVAIIGRKFQEAYDEHQASTQGASFSETSKSLQGGNTSPSAVPYASNSRLRLGDGSVSSTPSSHMTKQQSMKQVLQARRTVSEGANAQEGPTLSEMGRRLRLMKLPDGCMTLLAHELAEELEEAAEVQKEINSMQAFEAGRQAEVVEQFSNTLSRLNDLQASKTGGAVVAHLTSISARNVASGAPHIHRPVRHPGALCLKTHDEADSAAATPKSGSGVAPRGNAAATPKSGNAPRAVVTGAPEGVGHPCAVGSHDAEDVAPSSPRMISEASPRPSPSQDSTSESSVQKVHPLPDVPRTPEKFYTHNTLG